MGRIYQTDALEAAFPFFSDFHSIAENSRGGVFSVFDHTRGERVALKLVRDSGSEDVRQRMEQEFRLLTSIFSERLIRVFQASFAVSRRATTAIDLGGGSVEHLWFTMELGDSDVRKQMGSLPLLARVRAIQQLLEALCFLHVKRIAHRDIKPDNLFLFDGQIKIGDFDLARGHHKAGLQPISEGPIGTPQYLAPERWQPVTEATDWRPSDQYAAGVTLFEILSRGQLPLDCSSAISRWDWPAVEAVHRAGKIMPLSIPERPQASCSTVESLIRRMMSRDPAQRYPDIRECYLAFRTAVAHDRLDCI
ncbi:MAG: serine/threonine-protein kinase [Polyangia bacterium]